MNDRSSQLDFLSDLETRQDELLLKLEELDRQVEKTLVECLALRNLDAPPNARQEAA
jgi:hypothetical protein